MRHEPDLLREPPPADRLMETAYRRLKRSIIELHRPPGTQFSEQAVAREFGLSKTPVREALARLHRDGLVTPQPRAGYVVSPVTLSDVGDLCAMRSLLQSETAALTARHGLSAGEAARLQELCVDDEDGQLGGPRFEERFRDNYEFESIIANGCRNARLAAAAVDTLDEMERVVRLALRLDPSMPPGRIDERRALVDAVLAREPDTARAAMARRTASAQREIVGALTASAAVTSAPIALPL
ncbi:MULTISPECIES: GntR family transcriptional regulator [unclassified Pseudonocardia]|uniref:GntR family transcriptional regulator n=1 Tax=unclassified Pseudonocardia TaxID=2619320 RepID=UPI001CF705ED|nr:GntR family transcriptional regulator [Pseudonocardia sp. ICBG162]